MTRIKVDFGKTVGQIKPMHAVGQPPFLGGSLSIDFSFMEHLTKANIPYSRLHDVGGAYGGNRFVDIPNLFRDFFTRRGVQKHLTVPIENIKFHM